jgi:hypothetical protein
MHIKRVYNDPRARNKPCLRCNRSLLRHLDDRHCPTCGLSVWLSLNPNDSLDWSRASWLNRSARGAWLLAVAQLLALMAYGLAAAVLLRSDFVTLLRLAHTVNAEGEDFSAAMPTDVVTTAPTTTPVPFAAQALEGVGVDPLGSVLFGIASVLAGVHLLITALGLFQLVADEQRYPDRVGSIRIASQVSGAIAAGWGVLLVMLAVPSLITRSPGVWMFAWVLIVLTELIFVACAVCTWWWLRQIAHRARRSGLWRMCGYLLFLPLIPLLKVAPFFGLWFLFLASPLLYVLPIVYLPLATVLLARFARLMQSTAKDAEQNWAAETRVGTTVPPPMPA